MRTGSRRLEDPPRLLRSDRDGRLPAPETPFATVRRTIPAHSIDQTGGAQPSAVSWLPRFNHGRDLWTQTHGKKFQKGRSCTEDDAGNFGQVSGVLQVE